MTVALWSSNPAYKVSFKSILKIFSPPVVEENRNILSKLVLNSLRRHITLSVNQDSSNYFTTEVQDAVKFLLFLCLLIRAGKTREVQRRRDIRVTIVRCVKR